MDLVTLVTACALGVDPRSMQSLVWQQSSGNPWAVSVPGEPSPRVHISMQDAISATRALPDASNIVRVGLAGLPVAAGGVTPAVFLPCLNVAIAAQQIATFISRCAARPQNTPISCALAAYRGSWNKPDIKFAAAVARSASDRNQHGAVAERFCIKLSGCGSRQRARLAECVVPVQRAGISQPFKRACDCSRTTVRRTGNSHIEGASAGAKTCNQ